MKKKVVWLLVSGLMVLALALASCGPAVTEEEEEEVVGEEEEEQEEEVAGEEEEEEEVTEEPSYGGTLRVVLSSEVQQLDQAGGRSHSGMYYNDMTFDPLTKVDWTKGPAGTGESSMIALSLIIPKFQKGALAESWEFPDAETIIIHVRQGVRFHDKPPVNGRELVAEDVIFTLNRLYFDVPKSYLVVSFTDDRKPQSMTALDKYTIEMKIVPGMAGEVMRGGFDFTRIEPHEIFDTYENMEDWRRLIGTGPFMIEDHVASSQTSFVRNPDYWETDPFRPANQLPYLDGVKFLVIPDASTRQAALRTGKIDRLSGQTWEDWKSLLQYSPDLLSGSVATGGMHIWMKADGPPFDDIRVRRALALAVDQPTTLEQLYGGNGELISLPTANLADYSDIYVPLAELPESARELFEYHPDKAKQLLAEAGYPDGFKFEVLTLSADVDTLAIVKDYLADIGVEMELQVKEIGAWYSMGIGRNYQAIMSYGIGTSNPMRMHNYRTGSLYNYAILDDARLMAVYDAVPQPVNDAEWDERAPIFRDVVPYIIDQSWAIQIPTPHSYTLWQPWLKGYQGEQAVSFHHGFTWVNYVWIDQDLREEKTGTR